jgi:hypothetical protein
MEVVNAIGWSIGISGEMVLGLAVVFALVLIIVALFIGQTKSTWERHRRESGLARNRCGGKADYSPRRHKL